MKNNIEGVLIYCNKKKPYLHYRSTENATTSYVLWNSISAEHTLLNGKVVASCEISEWEKIQLKRKKHSRNYEFNFSEELLNKACITFDELFNYIGFDEAYALHLENVQPFKKQIKLSELCSDFDKCKVTKAPQSYMWVYYKGEKCLLLPIKPQHCYNILQGKKTIEFRRTLPKEVR